MKKVVIVSFKCLFAVLPAVLLTYFGLKYSNIALIVLIIAAGITITVYWSNLLYHSKSPQKEEGAIDKLSRIIKESYYERGLEYYNIAEYDKAWDDFQKAMDLGYEISSEQLEDFRSRQIVFPIQVIEFIEGTIKKYNSIEELTNDYDEIVFVTCEEQFDDTHLFVIDGKRRRMDVDIEVHNLYEIRIFSDEPVSDEELNELTKNIKDSTTID